MTRRLTSLVLALALGLYAAQETDLEENCDVQLLQVSQTIETKGIFRAHWDNFLNVLGQAQSDAILTPAVTGAAMLMELASGAPPKPMSLSQQETQVQTVSATTICVISAAVLLALIVCLVFSCFKPSTNYDTAMKSADGGFSQGAASSSLDRAMRADCC